MVVVPKDSGHMIWVTTAIAGIPKTSMSQKIFMTLGSGFDYCNRSNCFVSFNVVMTTINKTWFTKETHLE
jgi:hypothetical protein